MLRRVELHIHSKNRLKSKRITVWENDNAKDAVLCYEILDSAMTGKRYENVLINV